MAKGRPEGCLQTHFWILADDWQTIKTYCNKSGRRLYASDFVRVFLASLAAEMRASMERSEYASEIDLSRIKPMTISMMKSIEGDEDES